MATLGPMENLHFVSGLAPVADALAATKYSDVFEVQGEGAFWIIHKGVGATGTSTITVEACDDTTPTNSTAVAFYYRTCTTGDTWSDVTKATTAGFATTAGSAQMYQMWVPASELGEEGYGYARLKAVEVADDPVLAGILCGVYGLRNAPQPSSLID